MQPFTRGFLLFVIVGSASAAHAQMTVTAKGGRTRRLDLALTPLAGGDTDRGLGGGLRATLTAMAVERALVRDGLHDPRVPWLPRPPAFRWRLEAGAFATWASTGTGQGGLPYQSAFAQLTLPELFGGRLDLALRPSYTRESSQRYYGIGNAADRPQDSDPARDRFGRLHPTMTLRGRIDLGGAYSLLLGASYAHNWLQFQPGSAVMRDLEGGNPAMRGLLRVDEDHGVLLAEIGVGYDTRDDDRAPTRGQFHQLVARLSPQFGNILPYRYAQLNLTARFYQPVLDGRVTLAARLVGDLLMGDVPFYELARWEEGSAFGGARGVRGIPGDRYQGKIKVFGNLEARTNLFAFKTMGGSYDLGAVAFVDAGRVWADLGHTPALDGDGLGLKFGLGAGLRLQKRNGWIVRGDLAWSPNARPVGAYLTFGHTF